MVNVQIRYFHPVSSSAFHNGAQMCVLCIYLSDELNQACSLLPRKN